MRVKDKEDLIFIFKSGNHSGSRGIAPRSESKTLKKTEPVKRIMVCTESVSINNALDHNREVVTDASLNFSETNPDVRTPVLNRPTLLAGQNTGNQMDQWRKTLYIGAVSDGRQASVGSKGKTSKFSMK